MTNQNRIHHAITYNTIRVLEMDLGLPKYSLIDVGNKFRKHAYQNQEINPQGGGVHYYIPHSPTTSQKESNQTTFQKEPTTKQKESKKHDEELMKRVLRDLVEHFKSVRLDGKKRKRNGH